MTPDNELISTATRPTVSRAKRTPTRQRVSAVLAGLAVVGISAAMMAPSGVAVADPEPADAPVTAFSLASADTQSITVSVESADIVSVNRSAFEVYVKPKPTPPPAPAPAEKTKAAAPKSSPPAQPRYTGGGSKEEWMAAAGIASSDWPYVDYIVSKESGWSPNATNKSSGACGLVQALPCSKVPGNGYDPVDNLRWGNGYAVGRYGSWAGAYNFWTRNHWW
ncbi:aggregation-promoting factor C-terminal-like domain-containing protein [Microbacterium sp. NPDC055521]